MLRRFVESPERTEDKYWTYWRSYTSRRHFHSFTRFEAFWSRNPIKTQNLDIVKVLCRLTYLGHVSGRLMQGSNGQYNRRLYSAGYDSSTKYLTTQVRDTLKKQFKRRAAGARGHRQRRSTKSTPHEATEGKRLANDCIHRIFTSQPTVPTDTRNTNKQLDNIKVPKSLSIHFSSTPSLQGRK